MFQTAYSNQVKYETVDDQVKLTDLGKSIVTVNKKPSMTKQNLKDDADVNKIVKRFGLAQIQQNMALLELQYGEITSTSLQEAMAMLDKADKAFLEVPSDIRAKFNNDPGLFIDWVTNPENLAEARKLGLAEKEIPPEEPIQVEVINSPSNEETPQT